MERCDSDSYEGDVVASGLTPTLPTVDTAVASDPLGAESIDVGNPVGTEPYIDVKVDSDVIQAASPKDCLKRTPAEGPVREDTAGFSR